MTDQEQDKIKEANIRYYLIHEADELDRRIDYELTRIRANEQAIVEAKENIAKYTAAKLALLDMATNYGYGREE